MTDARKVHGQPARDVRVIRTDENLPVTVDRPRWGAVGDAELRRPGQVERSRPTFTENLEAEAVRQPVRDPRD
jgi:hypothetical protein